MWIVCLWVLLHGFQWNSEEKWLCIQLYTATDINASNSPCKMNVSECLCVCFFRLQLDSFSTINPINIDRLCSFSLPFRFVLFLTQVNRTAKVPLVRPKDTTVQIKTKQLEKKQKRGKTKKKKKVINELANKQFLENWISHFWFVWLNDITIWIKAKYERNCTQNVFVFVFLENIAPLSLK